MVTAPDLSPDDLAQIMAASFDIPPETYTGRTGDAIVAMTLLKKYRWMEYFERNDVLRIISDDMGFATTNFMFLARCRVAVAMMTANPVWVPGSLSNAELTSEITFWRQVSTVLGKLGFNGLPTWVAGNAKSLVKDMRKIIEDPSKVGKGAAIGASIKTALKPNSFTGATILGDVVKSIADLSAGDLESEAARRGLTREMSTLDTARYGARP